MADYNKTLELYKKLQQTGTTDQSANISLQKPANSGMVSSNIDQLNEAVFGKLGEGERPENTSKGQKTLMETMKQVETGNLNEETKERLENTIRNSKMPKAILESMISNPLIETKVGEDDIDVFMKKNMAKNTNIDASRRVMEKLNEIDNRTTPQPTLPRPTTALGVDIQQMREMIEEVVDSKLAQLYELLKNDLKVGLNESKGGNNTPGLMVIQEKGEGKGPLLLDTNGNVYECTFVYKGKNKKK